MQKFSCTITLTAALLLSACQPPQLYLSPPSSDLSQMNCEQLRAASKEAAEHDKAVRLRRSKITGQDAVMFIGYLDFGATAMQAGALAEQWAADRIAAVKAQQINRGCHV